MGINEYIKIGDRMRAIRINQGMTQRKVASMLGIPYSTYSNYENNNREPSATTLFAFAEILGVTVDCLLGFSDEKEPPQSATVSEDDLKIALFDGDREVTDEMWEEAKFAALQIKERYKRFGGKKPE